MAIEFGQEEEQVPGGVLVQVGGQLIQDQDFRIVDDGPGQFHAAAFAQREFHRIAAGGISKPHQAQRLLHPLCRRLLYPAPA